MVQLNINSNIIKNKFNKGYKNYQNHKAMQEFSGQQLIDQCRMYESNSIKTILDLGCGQGTYHPQLHTIFPTSCIYGVDIAYNMLWQRNHIHNNVFNNKRFAICTDGQTLPFSANTMDMVFANMYLHWQPELSLAIQEIHRILKHNGLFFFTTLSNKSFIELRHAWQQIDDYEHINPFFTIDTLMNAIMETGFKNLYQNCLYYCEFFNDMTTLLRHFKNMAANNSHNEGRKSLTTMRQLQKVSHYYENYRNDAGLLPLNYDIIIAVMRKLKS